MVKTEKSFDSAVGMLTQELQKMLVSLPVNTKSNTTEIRLRAGKPLQLTADNMPLWIDSAGAHFIPLREPYIISRQHINEVFMRLCENSVYSHENEIKQGYIVLKHGHRAGICGTVTPGGMIKDISSINIRIARQIIGCANKVIREFDGKGMLIAGPPASGKTTMLRDLVRQLSYNRQLRIAVVDTRSEIAACCAGVPANDLGDTVDVLNGYEKAEGIEIAVRTLNPQVVAFDELGNKCEVDAVGEAMNCGVAIITTLHAGNREEIFNNSKVKSLLHTGAISKLIILPHTIGEEIEVLRNDDFV